MIKRRFYKVEHTDRNEASDSSSSDSDADSIQEEEEEEEEEVAIAAEKPTSPSPGSGYEREDSSGNEVDCDTSGLLLNEDDEDTEKDGQTIEERLLTDAHLESAAEEVSIDVAKAFNARDSTQAEFGDYVLKCKSVFKCRICPRIVCLSEDTLTAHLNSKRHARSKKLLDEGRLKLMLNSDGEIEEQEETHAERHARIVALAQDLTSQKKKNKGRQRQRQRSKKRSQNPSKESNASESMQEPTKKRRKT